MLRTSYAASRIGVFFLVFCIILTLSTVVWSHNVPPESKQFAAAPHAPGASSSDTPCEGPDLISGDGESICLSCHHKVKHGSAKRIHRKHKDLACCECHMPTAN